MKRGYTQPSDIEHATLLICKALACELSTRYFMDGAHYLQAAEREMSMPSLFDAVEQPGEERKAA